MFGWNKKKNHQNSAYHSNYSPINAKNLFYRNNLPSSLHIFYDYIYEQIKQMNSRISLDGLPPISYDVVNVLWNSIMNDNPELFYIPLGIQIETLNNVAKTICICYTMSASQVDEINNIIKKQVQAYIERLNYNSSDYDKVKAAYEFIIKQTEYCSNTPNDQNISSVFVDKRSSCAGYSRALQYLLNQVDIPCYYIPGYVNGKKKTGGHAWNLAYINSVPVWIDITWGDPIHEGNITTDGIIYDYLCLTDKELAKTHTPAPDVSQFIPTCTTDIYDYYKMNALYFNHYVLDDVTSSIQNIILRNDMKIDSDTHGELGIKFASQKEYRNAISDLLGNNRIPQIISPVLNAYNKKLDGYGYSQNDELNIFHIIYNFSTI